jgi:Skp family chaperone for outer membrane proteins
MPPEEQTSVNDDNLEVISKEEFNKVYNTLQKERSERKELEKKFKAFGELTPESVGELRDKLAELELKKDSEIDINERLEKALKIKTAPFVEKEKEYQSKISEYETFISKTKQDKINSKLKDKISSVVLASDSPFNPSSIIDIEARARMMGLEYNEDADDFLISGQSFDKWLNEQAKNSTWNKTSQGAGAVGNIKNKSASGNDWVDILKNASKK